MLPAAPLPNRKRTIFVWVTAILALALLIATRDILLPFILALLIAYVLTPAVSLVERTRAPRWIAVLVVYAVTLGAIYGFFSLVAPRLVHETIGLRRELPGLSVKMRDQWGPGMYGKLRGLGFGAPEEEPVPEAPKAQASQGPSGPPSALRIHPTPDGSYEVFLHSELEVHSTGDGAWRISPPSPEGDEKGPSFDVSKLLGESVDKALLYGRRNIVEVLRFGSSIVAGISRGIFTFFLTLMLAAYIMITREKIIDFFRVMVRPGNRTSFNLLLARIDRGLAGVVRGQLLICGVNGVLTALGFSVMGLKYWPILSLLAAIMSIIPIFGSILSAIPAVAIGLTQGIGTGIGALAWIVVIHQIEANVLNPKIYGIAAKIHPVLVIFALLVGEHFFSLTGALLAVPCMSILQNIYVHFRVVALGQEGPVDTFVPPPGPKAQSVPPAPPA